MALLQDLDITAISDVLTEASDRKVPLTVMMVEDGRWTNYHSRMLDLTDSRFFLALPIMEAGVEPHEFVAGEKIGVSLKLRHHKYIFRAVVAGVELSQDADEGPLLSVCWPTHVQRLQRRAYQRAIVPEGSVVRLSFWNGGRQDEPTGGTSAPVWSGRILDISAGGFQAAIDGDVIAVLDEGFSVGVRIAFGAGEETVFADALVRHITEGPHGQSTVGFQLLGMGQTNESKEALRLISRKVAEFQRFSRS